MKKIIGILAAAALLFAVSSCSNDDGTSTVDGAVTYAQDVSKVASEASAKAAEKSGGDEEGGDEEEDENALTGTWTALDYATSTTYNDKTPIASGTSLGKVTVVGDGAVWRTDSDATKWAHLELGKAQAGCLQVTIGKTSTVVVSAASNGSSNTSDIFLGTSSGSTVGTADATTVTGSSYTDVTYKSVPAGTYYLGAFPATTNKRVVRIKSITVTAD